MPAEDPRLPTHVRPTRYEPHLEVDLDRETFQGRLVAELSIEEPTSEIHLHAAELDPEQIELTRDDRTLVPDLETDPEAQRWILHLPEVLEPGPAELSLTYEGQIGRDMSGLYLSQAGEDRCLVTQCEPSDARAVFPCFDEPAFKAQIAWRVRAPSQLRVLANGELLETREHQDGTATRVFEATPPVSSYLAAIAVGDFEATETRERAGVPFRVWALDEAEALGTRARDQAARLMGWFESFFDVPYPYAKYDQVAVPSFSFGAMENVGLVVFRESLLLLDRERATWDEAKAVDRVVAHELAHMWFGNLATMAWWDDLWLNEAFAEWIAHEAVDELEPDHQIWHAFRQRSDQALATDALDSTHAIYHPVATPAEAMEMFDAVTYGKGSAVMRMLADYLGTEAMQAGLSSYLEAFSQANATGTDLWDHLARASQAPVADVMRAWITQPGHPRLEIQLLEEDAQAGTVRLHVSQQRHRERRSTTLQAASWPVPVVLRYADSNGIHEHRLLLEAESEEIELATDGELAWLVGNAGQGGFYRVDHGGELEDRLRANARELDPAERWGLIRDSFSLVKAGEREVHEHLSLLDDLATGQAHFAFVDDVHGHCRELERLLDAHGEEGALAGYRAWIQRTFGPALDELGPRPRGGEKPARRHRRATALALVAGIGEDEKARAAALAIAEDERRDPDDVDAETATAAVHVAARLGEAERFATYVDTYRRRREADLPPQQVQRYLRSLPLFRGEDSVDELLTLIDEGQLPAQSIGPLLESMVARPHAQQATLAYVEANLEELADRVGPAWVARVAEAAGQALPGNLDAARTLLAGPVAEVAPESTKRARERLEQTTELLEAGVVEDVAAWARQQA